MELDIFPPPSQLPGLIAKKDPQPEPRRDGVDEPLRRLQHRLAEQQQGAAERQGPAGAQLRDQPRQHPARCSAARRSTRRSPTCCPTTSSARRTSTLPVRPDKAKQMLAEAGCPAPDAQVPVPERLRGQQQGVPDGPAGPVQGRHHGRAASRRRTRTSTRSTCRCRRSRKRGVWDLSLAGWGADWYGNAALSFFAPAVLRQAVVPAGRQQLRPLRQPEDQRPDRPGRDGDRPATRRRSCGRRPTSR